ncbi:MAG: hypothetical protein CFH17_00833 [Alphaproteobacteria bacterium MarineAlpha5_Bin7]|nr:MAG: hypothetical protein CFH17_00833 [Alphaproteobacteria bacterium MarineAlpha5_Bin7]|tara:strand:- start:2521 stop:2790 length:270 start_codon:yes stop_codon:yes gene_type:complete
MSENQSIKDTLSVIRKALEDDKNNDNIDQKETLILNHLVKDDGTIEVLNDEEKSHNEINQLLEKKINENFDKWMENKMPNYLEKYFDKK